MELFNFLKKEYFNIKLNKDKIKYKLQEVKYMGHILSKDGVKLDPEKCESIKEMKQP